MAVFTVINVVEQNNDGRTDMAAYNGFYQTKPSAHGFSPIIVSSPNTPAITARIAIIPFLLCLF